jgi:hypothetical protein
MQYTTELQLQVTTGRSADSFDQHTDEVLDALMDLDGVMDPDMAVNLSRGQVVISITSEADDAGEATMRAFTAVRAAIHQVGGWTPGWDEAIREAVANSAPSVVTDVTDCVEAR